MMSDIFEAINLYINQLKCDKNSIRLKINSWMPTSLTFRLIFKPDFQSGLFNLSFCKVRRTSSLRLVLIVRTSTNNHKLVLSINIYKA